MRGAGVWDSQDTESVSSNSLAHTESGEGSSVLRDPTRSRRSSCPAAFDDDDATPSRCVSDPKFDTAVKWENTSKCGLCSAKIGKRHFAPRHHCRICNLCVCAACSPSSVQLAGQKGLHRACNKCIGNASKATEVAQGVFRLGERLSSSFGGESIVVEHQSHDNIEEALFFCEKALVPVMEERHKFKVIEESQTKQIEAARLTFLRLGQKIHHLSGATSNYAWTSELQYVNLEEAAALCEKALDLLEGQHRRRGSLAAVPKSPSSAAATPPKTVAPIPASPPPTASRPEPPRRPAQQALLYAADDDGTPFDTEGGFFEPVPPRFARRSVRCCKGVRTTRAPKCFCRFIACAVVAAFVTFACLGAFRFLFLPRIVRSGLHASTVFVPKVSFENFHAENMNLRVSVVMASPFAGVAATVQSFDASLLADGTKVGRVRVPSFQLPFGAPASVDLDTQLTLANTSNVLSASVLTGAQHWQIQGSTGLTIFGQTVKLQVAKAIELPTGSYADIQAENMDIVSSDELELHVLADIRFFSSSAVAIGNFGPAAFVIKSSGPTGMDLGIVNVQDFKVVPGVNVIHAARITLRKKTSDGSSSEGELADVFGQWASGMRQDLLIRGPYIMKNGSPAKFHGMIEQHVSVSGLQSGVLKSAFIDGFYTIRGHMPESGRECDFGAGAECFRGPVNVVESRISRDVRIRDISLDADLHQPLSYDTELHGVLGGSVKAVRCPKRNHIARLFSAKGMWSFTNWSRALDDFVTVHGKAHGDKELTSFFLPAKPQPGQTNGSACLGEKDYDCCYTTVLSAAACYHKQRGHAFIPVSLKGNLTVVVGEFSISIHLVQRSLPVMFEKDITTLYRGFGLPPIMTCDDFRFK